jgi:hypothetical protein
METFRSQNRQNIFHPEKKRKLNGWIPLKLATIKGNTFWFSSKKFSDDRINWIRKQIVFKNQLQKWHFKHVFFPWNFLFDQNSFVFHKKTLNWMKNCDEDFPLVFQAPRIAFQLKGTFQNSGKWLVFLQFYFKRFIN